MLVSLVCYFIEAVVCIAVLCYMRVRLVYLVTTSVAFVCLFIVAVLGYTFVKQSISHIPGSLTTERLSNPIYDVSNGHIETIMIKTIAWYSPLHDLFRRFTFWCRHFFFEDILYHIYQYCLEQHFRNDILEVIFILIIHATYREMTVTSYIGIL